MGRRKKTWSFWDQTIFDMSGCILWTGHKSYSRGVGYYGRLRWKGRLQLAHRVAWQIVSGPIPTDHLVLHHCDNPLCVNPQHLFLGTQLDNIRDAFKKGRQPKIPSGEDSCHAKLTWEQVAAIRSSELTRYELASLYGVHYSTIGRIQRGQTWKAAP